MTKEQIINKLLAIFGDRVKMDDGKLMIRGEFEVIIPDDVEERYKNFEHLSNYVGIEYENSLEILVKNIDGHSRSISTKNDVIEISVNDVYSDDLCLAILDSLPREKFRGFIPLYFVERYLKEKKINLYDLIKLIFSEYHSITVKAINKGSGNLDLLQIAKSFIFNVSMLQNRNYNIVDNASLFTKEVRPMLRTIERNEIDVPYRKYIDEVVEYYISGNAARVPRIKYLSFYNVLEYFFDKVYIDDRCIKIQAIITNPKFNHNNLNNYKKILEVLDIKKAKNLEKVSITESESLKLLIAKHIEINDFKDFLQNNKFYLESDAYKISDTKFSLCDSSDDIIAKICKRVYNVRNALVHSKDGEDKRYIPQKDDVHIYKEIGLIKYLAEMIIIGNSTLIK